MKTKFLKKTKKKKVRIHQKIYQDKINSLAKIFLGSFLVVGFFYILPIISDYTEKNILSSKEFTNNSKKVLAYTLNEKKRTKEKDIIDEKDLLLDIFSLNDLETDTVRLSASTIKQLFQDTGYNLKDVRKKKISQTCCLNLTS